MAKKIEKQIRHSGVWIIPGSEFRPMRMAFPYTDFVFCLAIATLEAKIK